MAIQLCLYHCELFGFQEMNLAIKGTSSYGHTNTRPMLNEMAVQDKSKNKSKSKGADAEQEIDEKAGREVGTLPPK